MLRLCVLLVFSKTGLTTRLCLLLCTPVHSVRMVGQVHPLCATRTVCLTVFWCSQRHSIQLYFLCQALPVFVHSCAFRTCGCISAPTVRYTYHSFDSFLVFSKTGLTTRLCLLLCTPVHSVRMVGQVHPLCATRTVCLTVFWCSQRRVPLYFLCQVLPVYTAVV
jgi:hypothetical protein